MGSYEPPPIKTPLLDRGGTLHSAWQRWFINIVGDSIREVEYTINMNVVSNALDSPQQDYKTSNESNNLIPIIPAQFEKSVDLKEADFLKPEQQTDLASLYHLMLLNPAGVKVPGAHISDAETSHSITDPGDAPADADALRDDLVANAIPEIESALDALGGKINDILLRLEQFEINLRG